MTIEQKLNMALSYAGITQAELARRINTSPQNLNMKIKRNTLTKEDLEEIAAALGASFACSFKFKDGMEI